MPPANPLHALAGNSWVPNWALRPGSYTATAPLAGVMPLWLAIYTKTDDDSKPCLASWEDLGATIGCGRKKVGRDLKTLEKAGLLFVLDRGKRTTKQNRPPARWALDPFAVEVWHPDRDPHDEDPEGVWKAILRLAEDDGHDGRWVHRAYTSLDAFARRSRRLQALIADDMLVKPKPRKRRRRRPPRPDRAESQNGTGGEVFTQGGGTRARRRQSTNEKSECRRRPTATPRGAAADHTTHPRASDKPGTARALD